MKNKKLIICILAAILGNLILGFGSAVLKISLMGNDPYTAVNMAMSDGFHMGLGTFELMVNIILLVIQLIFGRKYLGFGSVVNLVFLGYIIEYSGKLLDLIIGKNFAPSIPLQILLLVIALILLSLGLSIYQTAALGVSPYDYLALGLTEHFSNPYFVNRVAIDGFCVILIVIACLTGFIGWSNSHLGIGTILCAFCLGPLINFFNKFSQKWIQK